MIISEPLLPLDDAGRLLPRPVHKTTVWRWVRRGLRGVKLESVRFGRNVYTSREALDRFGRALAALDASSPDPTPSPPCSARAPRRTQTGRRRDERVRAAEAFLAELGL